MYENAAASELLAADDSLRSPLSFTTVFFLCFFLGVFGAHRFYVKKTGTALIMLFTCGGVGVWALVDYFTIVLGNFTDKDGLYLKN